MYYYKLQINCKTTYVLEENNGENFYNPGIEEAFLTVIQQPEVIKNDRFVHIKKKKKAWQNPINNIKSK